MAFDRDCSVSESPSSLPHLPELERPPVHRLRAGIVPAALLEQCGAHPCRCDRCDGRRSRRRDRARQPPRALRRVPAEVPKPRGRDRQLQPIVGWGSGRSSSSQSVQHGCPRGGPESRSGLSVFCPVVLRVERAGQLQHAQRRGDPSSGPPHLRHGELESELADRRSIVSVRRARERGYRRRARRAGRPLPRTRPPPVRPSTRPRTPTGGRRSHADSRRGARGSTRTSRGGTAGVRGGRAPRPTAGPAAVESLQTGRRLEQPHASGCEFERERQPIEPRADLCHGFVLRHFRRTARARSRKSSTAAFVRAEARDKCVPR